MNGPQQRILQAGLGQNVVRGAEACSRMSARSTIRFARSFRWCSMSAGVPPRVSAQGVEACPVDAYGDGCGRGVAVALTVDQHAGVRSWMMSRSSSPDHLTAG
jgi:hypothetical protein